MTEDGLPQLAFANAEALARWLETNPDARGAWLKFAKSSDGETLTKSQAIDCALCWGWIDGQLGRLDDDFYLTRFTPRRPGGRWSAANVQRVEALLAQARIQPRGLAEIEAAKADGRWAAAYPSARNIATPDDFSAALARDAYAKSAFAGLDSANRYAFLYRLHHLKLEARASGIDKMVAMLARGESFHPARKPRPRAGSSEAKRKR